MFSKFFGPVFLKQPYYFLIPNFCILFGGWFLFIHRPESPYRILAAGLMLYGGTVIALRTYRLVKETFFE